MTVKHTNSADALSETPKSEITANQRSYLIERHEILGRTVRIDGGKDGLLAEKKQQDTEEEHRRRLTRVH